MAATASALRRKLLAWYARAGRDLPWRRTRDAYRVWVSETMLQQTRVETVVPYYERFVREFPTVHALAEAPIDRVLLQWSGLGYYRRARMLHAAAGRVAREWGGRVPSDTASLRALEGVGAYTAGAIASIAFGRAEALVDGNVARVLARLFAIEDDVRSSAGSARVWDVARDLVARAGPGDPGDWNQALMELGATVCLSRAPRCAQCPVAGHCAARSRNLQDRLPCLAPKRGPKSVRRSAIVLASGGAVLLARRRGDRLYGGLWEAPSADGPIARLATALAIDASSLRRCGHVDHVLSHRRLRVAVACGPLGRRRAWPLPGPDYEVVERFPVASLPTLATSTLARKILAVANLPPRGVRSAPV